MDVEANETLSFLQEKGDAFTKLSTVERKRLADLEDALAHVHEETDRFRALAKEAAVDVLNLHVQTPHPAYKRADGNDVGRQATIITKKVLAKLEAELNKLLQRRSEIISKNKQKKLEINHIRRMRIQTEIAHAKYEAQLFEIKQKIEQLSEESADIVTERERLVAEKEYLEKMNENEQKIFSEQHEAMSEFIKSQNEALEEALLKERKMDRNTMNPSSSSSSSSSIMNDDKNSTTTPPISTSTTALIKSTSAAGNSRKSHTSTTSSTEIKLLTNGGNGSSNNNTSHTPSFTLEEEIDMAKQVSKLTKYIHDEQQSLTTIKDRIASYESMFSQLKYTTSSTTLDDIINSFINHEEEMFSLYNFIQTMNNEIEHIQEQIDTINMNKIQFQHDQYELNEKQKMMINELHDKHEHILNNIEHYTQENHVHSMELYQLSQIISSLFFKLKCDTLNNAPMSNSASQYQLPTTNTNSTTTTNNRPFSASSTSRPSTANKNSTTTNTTTTNTTNNTTNVPLSQMKKSISSSNKQTIHVDRRNTMRRRQDSHLNLLMVQGVNENNIVEYLGYIEQKLIETVAAYIKATNGSTTTYVGRKKGGNNRRASTSGGLMTPAKWMTSVPSLLSIDDDIDNLLDPMSNSTAANIPLLTEGTSAGTLTTNPTTTTNTSTNNIDNINESNTEYVRPIDLSLFKEKLLNKIHAGLNHSLPLLPSNNGKNISSHMRRSQSNLGRAN